MNPNSERLDSLANEVQRAILLQSPVERLRAMAMYHLEVASLAVTLRKLCEFGDESYVTDSVIAAGETIEQAIKLHFERRFGVEFPSLMPTKERKQS